MTDHHAGGCQCGAVRFSASGLGPSQICHCRMCQKQFGSLFAPLVTVGTLEWTRGAPDWFQSSNRARRGFCAQCGTPLAYATGKETALALGAFDDPTVAPPTEHINTADRLSFLDTLAGLPDVTRHDETSRAFMASVRSFQHPDHDTDTWAPGEHE